MSEVSLSYRVVGSGRPLLLIHGFGISYNIWRNLVPLLSSHFMIVMIELPGIGGSPLPAEGQDYLSAALDGIEGVRRALGLEKWDVLGYSSGSRIAEAYVQNYAAHVCHAIFLAPLLVNAYKVRGLRLAFRLEQSTPALGNWILSGWRLQFLISLLGFNLRPDPLGDEWYAEISSAPMRVLKETIWAMIPVAARAIFRASAFCDDLGRSGSRADEAAQGRAICLLCARSACSARAGGGGSGADDPFPGVEPMR